MKISLKRNVYKLIIQCCFAMAFVAAGSVSFWGGYQQKEPEHLEEYFRRRNKRNKNERQIL